jgi:hypothetical protein
MDKLWLCVGGPRPTDAHIGLGQLITLQRVTRHCDPADLRLVILGDNYTGASRKTNFYASLRRQGTPMKRVPAQVKE